jgi:hypothetical protein
VFDSPVGIDTAAVIRMLLLGLSTLGERVDLALELLNGVDKALVDLADSTLSPPSAPSTGTTSRTLGTDVSCLVTGMTTAGCSTCCPVSTPGPRRSTSAPRITTSSSTSSSIMRSRLLIGTDLCVNSRLLLLLLLLLL